MVSRHPCPRPGSDEIIAEMHPWQAIVTPIKAPTAQSMTNIMASRPTTSLWDIGSNDCNGGIVHQNPTSSSEPPAMVPDHHPTLSQPVSDIEDGLREHEILHVISSALCKTTAFIWRKIRPLTHHHRVPSPSSPPPPPPSPPSETSPPELPTQKRMKFRPSSSRLRLAHCRRAFPAWDEEAEDEELRRSSQREGWYMLDEQELIDFQRNVKPFYKHLNVSVTIYPESIKGAKRLIRIEVPEIGPMDVGNEVGMVW